MKLGLICLSPFEKLMRNKLTSTARKSINKNESLGQLYRNLQETYTMMQTPLVHQSSSTTVSQ